MTEVRRAMLVLHRCVDFESFITWAKDSENDIWNMYLEEVKEDDQRITDAWKEDADGLLVFVSLNLLVSLLHLDDRLKDRSFLRNCWRIRH